jgi:hypothetical protein
MNEWVLAASIFALLGLDSTYNRGSYVPLFYVHWSFVAFRRRTTIAQRYPLVDERVSE